VIADIVCLSTEVEGSLLKVKVGKTDTLLDGKIVLLVTGLQEGVAPHLLREEVLSALHQEVNSIRIYQYLLLRRGRVVVDIEVVVSALCSAELRRIDTPFVKAPEAVYPLGAQTYETTM